MRLVEILVPTGKKQAVLDILEDEKIDYVVTPESSNRGFAAVVTFPLPIGAVEEVIEELREIGIDENTYTVIVETETVISRRFDRLEERYAVEGESDETIAREELQTKAKKLTSSNTTYVLMTVVSAVIATAGLLLNSAATVVGSMVIAPLIGPAMAASVGTVVDDEELFRRGIKLQLLGVGLAIASAAIFATALRFGNLVPPGLDPLSIPQVEERLAPNVLVLAVALGAGIAGIVSLTTGVSTALVGVMIAVALIPPAAAVGIGIAYGLTTLAVGAFIFVSVNVLSINLAALVVLWYSGYRPVGWFRAESARSTTLKRIAVLAIGVLVLTAVLGGVSYDTYSGAVDEQEIRSAIDAELDEPTYGDAAAVEVSVQRMDGAYPRKPKAVTVTVASSDPEEESGLADAFAERIHERTGHSVQVEVRYLRTEHSG
ncbi:TIGR00341 family protein [Halalkalirubrum salinum]|uniref:TIGR00341 family protein n=1 Tax=Halalkalirubrum salinum TaxID=2563889 RepID=UPI0010FBA015|nr:TIGR00341 family protein [Halalkalirubrum salinum]